MPTPTAIRRQIREFAPDTDYDELSGMDDLLDHGGHEVKLLTRGELVTGRVMRISGEEVMVDVGLKSEGVVVGRELFDPHYMEDRLDLEIGDEIDVFVLQPEGDAAAMLSIRRAFQEKLWQETERIYQEGTVVETRITEFNKGGVLVDVGPRGFVPMSQLTSLGPSIPRDQREELAEMLSALVGKTIRVKIIEMDKRRNRLILSERAAEREARAKRRDALLGRFKVGQVVNGRVSNLATFGAFIDLGGADGLAHISELAWSRVSDPAEVLKAGDEIDVYILALDRVDKKIALSVRRTKPDPWRDIESRYAVEQVVDGTVTNLATFGVFVRLEDGIEGLAHVADVEDGAMVGFREGDVRKFKILNIETRRRRIRLLPSDAAPTRELAHLQASDNEGGTIVGTAEYSGPE